MRTRRVLLIDDDSDEQIILSHALTSAGMVHYCTWADGVDRGIALLKDNSYDIIFIDLNMPRINGLEGIGMIRNLPGASNVPLVLYSTGLTRESGQQALKAGASFCLAKDANTEAMIERFRHHFSTMFQRMEEA